MKRDYILLHHRKMPLNCKECSLKKYKEGREHCIFTMAYVDDSESQICRNEMCPLQRSENHVELPEQKDIEEIAFELFNSDFGLRMTLKDWEWWPDKIKNYYRKQAKVASLAWERRRCR